MRYSFFLPWETTDCRSARPSASCSIATGSIPGSITGIGSTTSISGSTMTAGSTIISVRPQWRSRIPAVIHVDGTARPQIVRDSENPLYAAILRRFRAATGLPVLVNTSFNVHEEPIVNRPAECLQALLAGRVDFVVTEKAVYTT